MKLQKMLRFSKIGMSISITTFVLVSVVGIQLARYQKQTNRRLQAVMTDTHIRTTELNIKLDDLRRQKSKPLANSNAVSFEEAAPVSDDCEALVNGCYEELGATGENTPPATTTVLYINQLKGLSIKFPYNWNWGTGKYTLPPYEEDYSRGERTLLEGISFGPIILGEGGLGRQMGITFEQATSVRNIFNDLLREGAEYSPTDITLMKIHGLDAVGYMDTGLCGGPILIVQGKKFNYRLGKYCSPGNVSELVEIAKTIKLLP